MWVKWSKPTQMKLLHHLMPQCKSFAWFFFFFLLTANEAVCAKTLDKKKLFLSPGAALYNTFTKKSSVAEKFHIYRLKDWGSLFGFWSRTCSTGSHKNRLRLGFWIQVTYSNICCCFLFWQVNIKATKILLAWRLKVQEKHHSKHPWFQMGTNVFFQRGTLTSSIEVQAESSPSVCHRIA